MTLSNINKLQCNMVLFFCRSSLSRHEQHSINSINNGMFLHYYYKLIGPYPASLLSASARKGKADIEADTKIFPINIGQDNASTMTVILLFPLSNLLSLKQQTPNTL